MGVAYALNREFDLTVEWLRFQTHTDTPQPGMLMLASFTHLDTKSMFHRLRGIAAPYGIVFVNLTRISNAHMSLAASEFSK
jgi:drug/metabolite transporter superfamily protein YnfA